MHILFDKKKAFLPKMMVASMAFFELCVLCTEEVETFLFTPGDEVNLNSLLFSPEYDFIYAWGRDESE